MNRALIMDTNSQVLQYVLINQNRERRSTAYHDSRVKLKILHGKISTGFNDNISFRIQITYVLSLCKRGERVLFLLLEILYQNRVGGAFN